MGTPENASRRSFLKHLGGVGVVVTLGGTLAACSTGGADDESASTPPASEGGGMKIISYNIFEGVVDTRAELAEYVIGQDPDVLCIQEANGWDENDHRIATAFGEEVGLPHLVFGVSNTQYHLAIFSKEPFIDSEVHTDGIFHCTIHVTLPHGDDVLHLWNVHLDPRSEDDRLKEADLLLSLMDPGQDQPVLAMGDFNSLSPQDDYPGDLHDDLLAQGVTKFGEEELRFDVMQKFADGGMTDVAQERGTADSSVPTPVNDDEDHAAQLRLDYLLANDAALPMVGSAIVEKNEETDGISDHYPLAIAVD
jgi:exodeoxyribonuclease-3